MTLARLPMTTGEWTGTAVRLSLVSIFPTRQLQGEYSSMTDNAIIMSYNRYKIGSSPRLAAAYRKIIMEEKSGLSQIYVTA